MKTAYILVGVPGSGKSTWVANQKWSKDCSYISTDQWVDLEAERTGKTYSDVFAAYMPKAISLMIRKLDLAKAANMDIIWDQTSTTVASRKKKLKFLQGYHTVVVVFKIPEAEELKRRLNSRPGKHIPDNVMKSMIAGFEMPTEEEGFDEIWHAE